VNRPVNPYNIQIIGPVPEVADDTAFTAFEKGVDAAYEQILVFLMEHNYGTKVETWNHGKLERITQSLALDSTYWEELKHLCR
jgi:hypothetical protein